MRASFLLCTCASALVVTPRAAPPQAMASTRTMPLTMGIFDQLKKAFDNEDYSKSPAKYEQTNARASHILVKAESDAMEIKEQIAASSVVVYSKSWCPFCQQTKATLDSMSIEYTAIELDELDAGADIQAALLGMTQQRTVPNVFVKGAHLGGNDDTQRAARDGRLAEMLK